MINGDVNEFIDLLCMGDEICFLYRGEKCSSFRDTISSKAATPA